MGYVMLLLYCTGLERFGLDWTGLGWIVLRSLEAVEIINSREGMGWEAEGNFTSFSTLGLDVGYTLIVTADIK